MEAEAMILAKESRDGKSSPTVLAERLDKYIKDAAAKAMSLHEVEQTVFNTVLEMGRGYVDLFIALQGNGDLGSTYLHEGDPLYRSGEPVERLIRSIFGEHSFHAYVYAPGAKKKIMLRPVDARLGLPEGRFSYLFQEFSQYFCVEQAFGQAAKAMAAVLQQDVCVDSLEHINQQLGAQADIFLHDLPVPPATQEGELLVGTADGKGVPLLKEGQQAQSLFTTPERPGNRRMAILGSVYSVDRYVRTPEEIVAALFRDQRDQRPPRRPEAKFKQVLARFTDVFDDGQEEIEIPGAIRTFGWMNDVLRARHQPDQPLIRLMDGQEYLWQTAGASLDAVPAKLTVDILDIIHVSGYVWRAAKVFYAHTEQREAFTRERLLRILQGQVKSVIMGLRQMATRHGLTGKERKEIATVCNYFANNASRMRYDEYLRAGYPIASGVIEGACRHLVKDRMERSGMRWTLHGAEAMLNVRAVHISSYWKEFHEQRIALDQQRLYPYRRQVMQHFVTPVTLAA
jgi:hypothetical protein